MTYERWELLLHRAWDDGVRCVPHPTRRGFAMCTSARHKGVRYTVNEYQCNCPARGDCKHRALFLFERPELLPLVVDAIPTERDEIEEIIKALGA